MGDAVSAGSETRASERALSFASKCRHRAHDRVPRGLSRFVSDGALDRPSFLLIANSNSPSIPRHEGLSAHRRFLAGSTNRLYKRSTVVSPLERTGSHPDASHGSEGVIGNILKEATVFASRA